jgi:hypothetical protein
MLTTLFSQSGAEFKNKMSNNQRTVDRALEELRKNHVLLDYRAEPVKDGRKIVDVKYTLVASFSFTQDIKRANGIFKKQKEEYLKN